VAHHQPLMLSTDVILDLSRLLYLVLLHDAHGPAGQGQEEGAERGGGSKRP
jgi:hypothetical protein